MIDLSGTWRLEAVDGGYECDVTFPGDCLSALIEAGHLPDPYFGRNEYKCRWPAEQEWIAKHKFEVEDKGRWQLRIDGLDTVAEVRVNGSPVIKASNAFRPHRADVSSHIKAGENDIAILFRSNPREGQAIAAKQPYPVPHTKNNPVAGGNMLRKVQCDFGWDWGPCLMPFGLLGDIALLNGSDVEIGTICVEQRHENGKVTLDVAIELHGQDATNHMVRLRLGDTTTEFPVQTDPDKRSCGTLELDNPELWWPAGQGDQKLHELNITVGKKSKTIKLALRDVKLHSDADETGSRFALSVNGREIFAKGANWIPADALPSRITREKTRDLLQSAVDANMNMIRIWGGGRYEPDWFYEICDELGLMVWQDFMFSCNLYPADEAFLAEVSKEVHYQAARLSHRVTLWCGDNELVGALTWYDESVQNRDRYLVAYDRLNRTIETALKETLPQALWWPSSPSPGHLDFGDAWHDDSKGDMHFWSVWHEGRDFEHYRDIKPRFCSEFGFQSYTSMSVIKSFADEVDMNIASPVMESHQKNEGGNARIAETMFRYFRFPEGFENFVYLSQVQQGLAIKTAVDYWRSLKPHCMGALYWQLNDVWPVASWSSLDYGGNWKLLHYMARRFFAPIVVTAIPDGELVRFIGVNDAPVQSECALTLFAASMDGAMTELGGSSAILGPNATEIFCLNRSDLPDGQVLYFEWFDGTQTQGDHVMLERYKSLPLQPSHIKIGSRQTESGIELTLRANALSFFASVEADLPGRFSDNAIVLLPERPQKISFMPADPAAKPQFSVRDLYSATYSSSEE